MPESKSKYICLYHNYLDAIDPLSDAERGRLFTALLRYGMTGAEPELNGNERFIFPMMRAQADRDMAAYEEKCANNSANGKLGGRPKAKKPNGFEENQSLLKKANKAKEKEKEKEFNNNNNKSPQGRGLDCANLPEANAVLADSNNPFAYYEQHMGTLRSSTADEIRGYFEVGIDAKLICKAIDKSLDSTAKNWNYARRILDDCVIQNIKTVDDYLEREKQFKEQKKLSQKRSSPDAVNKPDNSKRYGTIL